MSVLANPRLADYSAQHRLLETAVANRAGVEVQRRAELPPQDDDARNRCQLTAFPRERILLAAADIAASVGYAGMTVERITAAAKVSRRTFYELFADCEACFLGVFDCALSQARVLASEAYASEQNWREGIRSALACLLAAMQQRPELARVCVIEAPAAGEQVLERRALVLDELARMIDRGRRVSDAHNPAALTAESVVGGVFSVLYSRLLERDQDPLTDLLDSLMSIIVLPYLGEDAARRELSRGTHPTHEQPPPRDAQPSDPADGRALRLTLRTGRALAAIAENPGASNVRVAEHTKIVDPGQVSRLLHRLARQGLIENRGPAEPANTKKAWELTPLGAEFERASRTP
jgi:AcrR family transcriptional regulator/DNA-binding MarR family transcriptional regulator